jgi:thiol-disulfide isomerase/thioredoxin
MKKIISSLLIAIASFSCTTAQNDVQFTSDALNHELLTQTNEKISFQSIIDENKGKITIIEVWASWCSDCIKAMPQFKEIQNQYKDVNYVFLSVDKSFEKFNDAIAKYDLNGKHYWVTDGMKGDFGKSINLDWIPRYIILDKNGKVVLYKAIEKDFDKIKNTLNTLK